MILLPYREAEHYALIASWRVEGPAQEPPAPQDLPGDTRPGYGVLAWHRPDWRLESMAPLACGFIYETGTTLWLGPHYLCVNPALHRMEGGKALGHQALDAVVGALEAYVASAGGGALASFSDEAAVIARARRLGYQLRGRTPMLGKWIPALGASAAASAASAAAPDAESQGGARG